MLKYRVILSFVAIWCAVCLAYTGTRTALNALIGGPSTSSKTTDNAAAATPTEEVETEIAPITVEESQTKTELAQEAEVAVESDSEVEEDSVPTSPPESAPEAEPYEEPEAEDTETPTYDDWPQVTVEVEGSEEIEAPAETEAPEQSYAPSLYEYLSQFTCGSCRRNCSLSNPRCHNGSMLAQIKAQEYYDTYGQ